MVVWGCAHRKKTILTLSIKESTPSKHKTNRVYFKKELYTSTRQKHEETQLNSLEILKRTVSLESQSLSLGFRKVMISIINKLEAKCVLCSDVCVHQCNSSWDEVRSHIDYTLET